MDRPVVGTDGAAAPGSIAPSCGGAHSRIFARIAIVVRLANGNYVARASGMQLVDKQ
jgi:hypothetical protein